MNVVQEGTDNVNEKRKSSMLQICRLSTRRCAEPNGAAEPTEQQGAGENDLENKSSRINFDVWLHTVWFS
jgi:hypothetical protein